MEDAKIIDLFWARNEDAIAETDAAYRLRCVIIVNMLLIAYAPFVNAFEFQPAEQCAPPPFF